MKQDSYPSCNFPTDDEIDALNKECYNNIADEYSDSSHASCRDFDRCTQLFLNIYVEGKFGENKFLDKSLRLRYLDIGVGTGATLDTLIEKVGDDKFNRPFIDLLVSHASKIDVLDISEKMLNIVRKKFDSKISEYINESIYRYSSDMKYDLIIATMCDPYLTSSFVQKTASLLDNGGVLLLTFPHNQYMKKARNGNFLNKTTFKRICGRNYESFSFCRRSRELVDEFLKWNVHKVNSNTRFLKELSSKHQISSAHTKLLARYKESAFCSSMVLKKLEVSEV